MDADELEGNAGDTPAAGAAGLAAATPSTAGGALTPATFGAGGGTPAIAGSALGDATPVGAASGGGKGRKAQLKMSPELCRDVLAIIARRKAEEGVGVGPGSGSGAQSPKLQFVKALVG